MITFIQLLKFGEMVKSYHIDKDVSIKNTNGMKVRLYEGKYLGEKMDEILNNYWLIPNCIPNTIEFFSKY